MASFQFLQIKSGTLFAWPIPTNWPEYVHCIILYQFTYTYYTIDTCVDVIATTINMSAKCNMLYYSSSLWFDCIVMYNVYCLPCRVHLMNTLPSMFTIYTKQPLPARTQDCTSLQESFSKDDAQGISSAGVPTVAKEIRTTTTHFFRAKHRFSEQCIPMYMYKYIYMYKYNHILLFYIYIYTVI